MAGYLPRDDGAVLAVLGSWGDQQTCSVACAGCADPFDAKKGSEMSRFVKGSGKRSWPDLRMLIVRDWRHWMEYQAWLAAEQAAIEEQQKTMDGTRLQSIDEATKRLAEDRVLVRLPGKLHSWSTWITGEESPREFSCRLSPSDEIITPYLPKGMLYEDDEVLSSAPPARLDPSIVVPGDALSMIACDKRGVGIGLYPKGTFVVDHFVTCRELVMNYQIWSTRGLGDFVIAPADCVSTGEIPMQPEKVADGERGVDDYGLPEPDLRVTEIETSFPNPSRGW